MNFNEGVSIVTESFTVPILGEELSVKKISRVMGRVSVRTSTEETTEWVSEQLKTEQVEVERVEIGTEISAIPPTRTEGDVTIIPVVEERLIVRKQLFLVEEIHVRKQVRLDDVSAPVAVRRQHVHVERSGESKPNTKDD